MRRVGRDAWQQIQASSTRTYQAVFVPDPPAANVVNINGHLLCMKVCMPHTVSGRPRVCALLLTSCRS